MKLFTYTALLSLVCMINQLHAQNGWTRTKNGYYFQLSASHFATNNYYSTEGILYGSGSKFISNGLIAYGEFGLTSRITGVLDLPVLMLNRFSTTGTVAGVGNIRIGAKYRLIDVIPLSVQVDLDIPTGNGINYATAKRPNALGIFEEINLPTTDGEFNVWTTLAASASTSDGKTYGNLFAAANFRTQSFTNQYQAGLEIGHLFFKRLYVIGKCRIQNKLVSSKETHANASFLYGEGTTYTAYNLSLLYKVNSRLRLVGALADFSGAIVSRRNIYDGVTYTLGVAIER